MSNACKHGYYPDETAHECWWPSTDTAELRAARQEWERLERSWPSDGWDGAGDARARHHQLVIEAKRKIQALEVTPTGSEGEER
jgi:hypothetical protein